MSAPSVADLFADLLAPAVSAEPRATPAKAANSANREQRRGFPADSGAANGLRILANPTPPLAVLAPDSQRFAGDSQALNRLDRKHWRGDSQDSQDSQRSTRAGTIEARLIRWGWPPAEAAATAARIARRDDADDRRTCVECSRFRLRRCGAHRAAGLIEDGVGRDLAGLPQRCPGYAQQVDARSDTHRREPETRASAGDWADRVSFEVSA